MKQILIINLDKNQNPYLMASVAATLKYAENAQIHVLTLDSYEAIYLGMQEIAKVQTIAEQELLKLLNHRIYSSFQALEKIQFKLQEVASINYSTIYNLSTQESSFWITSFLGNSNVQGMYKKPNQVSDATNLWYWLGQEKTGLNRNETSWKAIGLDEVRCRFSPKEDKEVEEFSKNLFRFYKHENNRNKKLIGIEVSSEENVASLPFTTLCEIAEKLIENTNVVPVFMVNKSIHSSKIAYKLSEQFDRRAIIINNNPSTICYIARELNFIVTNTSQMKNLVDELSIPQLWITTNSADTYQSHPMTEKSLILTTEAKYIPILNALDINKVISYLLGNEAALNDGIDNTISLNEVVLIEGHAFPLPLTANFQPEKLYATVFENCYWLNQSNPKSKNLEKILKLLENRSLEVFSECYRGSLEQLLSLCLNGLRTLKASRNNKYAAKDFYESIDSLLNYNSDVVISRTLATRFKMETDNISGNSLEENIQQTETILLNLKNKISDAIFLVDRLRSTVNESSLTLQE